MAAALAVAVMATALTGCGGGSSSGGASGGSSASASSGGASGGSSDEVVTLRFAGQSPESSPAYAESEWFCEKVKEDSNGTLIIEFYPYNQLGDSAQVYEEIIMGTIDMGLINPQETITPLAAVGKIPGIAFSEEEFKEYFGPGSYCDTVTNQALADVGVRCFGTYFGGITGIATNKEAKEPANPDVPKGVLVRSPASTAYTSAILALGFEATPMAYSEIYTSMQTGIVDGYGGGMPHTVIASFGDLVKYYYDYNIVSEALCAMINEDVYSKLSPEHQKILGDNYAELVARSYSAFGDYEEGCMDQLEESGVTVVKFTEEERQAYVEKVRETSWTALEDVYGKEFFDGLRKEMGL